VKAFVPVRIRLVTPISMGRSLQVIAPKRRGGCSPWESRRTKVRCRGFESRLRSPISAAPLVHREF